MDDDLDEITRAKRRAEESLLRRPGVVGVGVGVREVGGDLTDDVAILVYVSQKKPADRLHSEEVIPPMLDGHRTDVIERPEAEFAHAPGEFHERPLACGLQIARYFSPLGFEGFFGTIGCFVEWRSNDHPVHAENMLLTCAHVLHPNIIVNKPMADEEVYQHESHIGFNSIGVATYRKEETHFGGLVDASFAWTGPEDGCRNYVWKIGSITGATRAKLMERVSKFGRTTGLTHGTITDIDSTLPIPARGKDVRFTNQIYIRADIGGAFVAAGDSGAVILNTDRKVVGLLFAGSGANGYANHIENVFDALDVKLAGV